MVEGKRCPDNLLNATDEGLLAVDRMASMTGKPMLGAV